MQKAYRAFDLRAVRSRQNFELYLVFKRRGPAPPSRGVGRGAFSDSRARQDPLARRISRVI